MAKDWTSVRTEIYQSYVVSNMPLAEVMRLVKGKFGFIASERSYRTQLLKWGYTKYSTETNPKPKRTSHSRRNPIPHSATTTSINNVINQGAGAGAFSLPGVAALNALDNSRDATYLGTANGRTAEGLSHAGYMNLDHQPVVVPSPLDLAGRASDGGMQLHQAVTAKNAEWVKSLLFSGAAVNLKDDAGNEPLHHATLAADDEIVQLLLRFGADPNAKGQLWRSPLHMAVSHPSIVDLLLKEGADASAQDWNGDAPLHLAIPTLTPGNKTTPPVVEALFAAGCDLNQPNLAGLTPFLKFLISPQKGDGYFDLIVTFLKRGGSVLRSLPDGRTPLQVFLTVAENKWARMSNFREHKAMWAFLDKWTPIETATCNGELLVVEYFKERYSRNKHPDLYMGKVLCERWDPVSNLGGGDTLLHKLLSLCVYGDKETDSLVDLLLKRGADVNRRNFAGQTPLSVLFEEWRNERFVERTAQVLVENGAEVAQRSLSQAADLYPRNDNILRILLPFYVQRLRDDLPTDKNDSLLAKKPWWDDWEHAARGDDWTGLKRLISTHQSSTSPNSNSNLADAAYSFLAERLITVVKARTFSDRAERENAREYVAGILRLCRSHWIPVDMSCFDYLLELCL